MKKLFVIAMLAGLSFGAQAQTSFTGVADVECGEYDFGSGLRPSCRYIGVQGAAPANVTGALSVGGAYWFVGKQLVWSPMTGRTGYIKRVTNQQFPTPQAWNGNGVEFYLGLGCLGDAVAYKQGGGFLYLGAGSPLPQSAAGAKDWDFGLSAAFGSSPCPDVVEESIPAPQQETGGIWKEIFSGTINGQSEDILIIDGEYPDNGDNPGPFENIYVDFGTSSCDQNAVVNALSLQLGITAKSHAQFAPDTQTYLNWMKGSGMNPFHEHGAVYRCVENGDVVYNLITVTFSPDPNDADGIDDDSVEVSEVRRHSPPPPPPPVFGQIYGTPGDCEQYQLTPSGTKVHASDQFEVQEWDGSTWVSVATHVDNPTWQAIGTTIGNSSRLRLRTIGIGGVSSWFDPGPQPCPCREDSNEDEEEEE